MADWMKIEKTLPDKLEVLQLAGMLSLSEDEVVGKLFRFWCWVDDNLKDCNAHGVTFVTIDRIANCKNFAAGLVRVGWLEGREGRLSIPHFDRHFGQSAKMRAVTNKRVRAHREARKNTPETCNAPSVTYVTPKALPEEKRIEYTNTMVSGSTTVDIEAALPAAPPPPADLPDGFGEWLGAMCGCVRAFREARSLHPEVTAEARAAYERFPRAAEYAELLRAYYDDRLREDSRRKEFWRPQGGSFFRDLEDVVFKHAQRWAREVGWKKKRGGSKPPAVSATHDDGMYPSEEYPSEEEKKRFFEDMKNDVGM